MVDTVNNGVQPSGPPVPQVVTLQTKPAGTICISFHAVTL